MADQEYTPQAGDSTPRVIDGRGHDFFIVDNPVVDQRIEKIDAKRRADALAVYTILCRRADNKTGKATIRVDYFERKTGRSKPIILDALKALRGVELIRVQTRKINGRQVPSTYTLLRVDRVKDDNAVPEVQSQNNDATGSTGFTALEDSTQEDSEKRAARATKALEGFLGYEIKDRERDKTSSEFVELCEGQGATGDDLLATIEMLVERLPRFRAGLKAYGPLEAFGDVRRERSKPKKTENGARAPISGEEGARRRREGYEDLFAAKTKREKAESVPDAPRDESERALAKGFAKEHVLSYFENPHDDHTPESAAREVLEDYRNAGTVPGDVLDEIEREVLGA